MKQTTKVISIFTAILLILSAIPITASAASWNITVKVNNKAVTFSDQKPIVRNERTLVPIRFVVEALGYLDKIPPKYDQMKKYRLFSK